MTSLIQDSLSTAQAIPLAGAAVSVVKASFSIVEMVASLALLILSLPFGEASKDLTDSAAYHLNEGWEGLVYSFANFMTLGIYGILLECEGELNKFKRLNEISHQPIEKSCPNIYFR